MTGAGDDARRAGIERRHSSLPGPRSHPAPLARPAVSSSPVATRSMRVAPPWALPLRAVPSGRARCPPAGHGSATVRRGRGPWMVAHRATGGHRAPASRRLSCDQGAGAWQEGHRPSHFTRRRVGDGPVPARRPPTAVRCRLPPPSGVASHHRRGGPGALPSAAGRPRSIANTRWMAVRARPLVDRRPTMLRRGRGAWGVALRATGGHRALPDGTGGGSRGEETGSSLTGESTRWMSSWDQRLAATTRSASRQSPVHRSVEPLLPI